MEVIRYSRITDLFFVSTDIFWSDVVFSWFTSAGIWTIYSTQKKWVIRE